jgi:PAS domain S-box-containing protein
MIGTDPELKRLRRQIEDLQAENADLRTKLENSRSAPAAALRQSEEKFRLAFHTSPDSINLNRLADGTYLDVNEGFTNLTGYTRDEVIGRTSVDLGIWCHPSERDGLVAALTRSGYVENFEARFHRKNGETGYGLMSARVLKMGSDAVILSITRDITARKRLEEALVRSEAQHRAIFENAVEGFFQSTPEGRFLRVNRALAAMCGYESSSQMMAAVSDIARQHYGSQADRERFMALLSERGVVENFEHTARRKDGSTFWVSVSARTVRDGEGHVLYYEGSHVDIDERKRTEKRLTDATEQYRSLFDTSTNAILIRDRTGIITMVNRAAVSLLGAEQEEDLVGRTYLEFVHPDDRPLSDARVRRIFEIAEDPGSLTYMDTATIRPREHRMLMLGGDTIEVESTGIAYQYKGEFFIQGIFRDITDRKRAEQKLRETEKKYRELAESLPQVIFEIDAAGRLLYLNQKGHELFGYTREDLDREFSVLDRFVAGDRERVARNIALSLQGQPIGKNEYTAVRKDGTTMPVQVHAKRVLQEDRAVGIRGILLDLTPIRQAQAERERLEAQLQQAQKMEAIGALAGGIAHDFNNILSAIIGYTELAMLNEGAEHCGAELKQALQAAKRARDLIKQILAFSRQTEEDRMAIRVGLVVKECIKFLRATIPSTIEIKTRIDDKAGTVFANSVELHQIIMNLCTNALHAIGDQSGTLEIAVEATRVDEAQRKDAVGLEVGPYVRVSVRDTGGGIPPEIIGRIFDPYFTTKAKGVGTGLGLAVVHGIVRKSGGAIQVESEPGQGATFHILLPRVDPPAVRPAEDVGAFVGGTERVLFVDDEMMLAGIGQEMLRRLGYDVTARTSPVEALELFKAKPGHFDLVITDQTMPGMTGDALARELMRIRPGLPVIICTGYSQIIDEQKAGAMGIRGFVMKPILIQSLGAAIRKALEPT